MIHPRCLFVNFLFDFVFTMSHILHRRPYCCIYMLCLHVRDCKGCKVIAGRIKQRFSTIGLKGCFDWVVASWAVFIFVGVRFLTER